MRSRVASPKAFSAEMQSKLVMTKLLYPTQSNGKLSSAPEGKFRILNKDSVTLLRSSA
jgi:hypothetical protein